MDRSDDFDWRAFEAGLVLDYLDGQPVDDADNVFIEAWLYERHRSIFDSPDAAARKQRVYDAERGRMLLKVRAWRDRRGYTAFLRKHKLAHGRARKFVALAGLADADPGLFERIAGLSQADLLCIAELDRADPKNRAALNVAARLLTSRVWRSDRIFVSPDRLRLPQDRVLEAPGVVFVGRAQAGRARAPDVLAEVGPAEPDPGRAALFAREGVECFLTVDPLAQSVRVGARLYRGGDRLDDVEALRWKEVTVETLFE